MRYLAVLFSAFALAACSMTPVARSQTRVASPVQAVSPEVQEGSMDAALQFLLAAAAADFHTHRPSDAVRFRDVRIGHVRTPDGADQYMLCGQFISAQEGDNAEWMPFATIKTSGYEHWMGAQAAGLCQRRSITWDKQEDLSSSLQTRLDSLR